MIESDLPRVTSIKAKVKRKEKLTKEERLQLEGHEAAERIKNRRYPKGSYVHFKTNVGELKVIVANSDDKGNYLIEYALGNQAVLRPKDIVESYLILESTLIEQDEYLIGRGLYERVVNKDGLIVKFYNNRLESMRVKGETVILPESERLRPGDDWGMIPKN